MEEKELLHLSAEISTDKIHGAYFKLVGAYFQGAPAESHILKGIKNVSRRYALSHENSVFEGLSASLLAFPRKNLFAKRLWEIFEETNERQFKNNGLATFRRLGLFLLELPKTNWCFSAVEEMHGRFLDILSPGILGTAEVPFTHQWDARMGERPYFMPKKWSIMPFPSAN